MLEARTRIDFQAAQAALDRCDAVAQKLMDMQPVPMLSAGRLSTYVNYMKRFFRHATEQGYARVTGGNTLVAAAEDEWDFQIDPLKVGRRHRAVAAGDDGRKLAEDQDLEFLVEQPGAALLQGSGLVPPDGRRAGVRPRKADLPLVRRGG